MQSTMALPELPASSSRRGDNNTSLVWQMAGAGLPLSRFTGWSLPVAAQWATCSQGCSVILPSRSPSPAYLPAPPCLHCGFHLHPTEPIDMPICALQDQPIHMIFFQFIVRCFPLFKIFKAQGQKQQYSDWALASAPHRWGPLASEWDSSVTLGYLRRYRAPYFHC